MRSLLLVLLLPVATWATYDWNCNLHCFHDGECRHGKGKFGSYAGVDESEVLPWDREVEPGVGMYCACPVGYTGLQCEIAMKVCGNDEHTCFNGAACAKETDKDNKMWWRCECDVAESVLDANYAGKYCEHIATVFCNKKSGDIGLEQSLYCTNGGKCKKKDHEGQKHVGCICQDGFEGGHCETMTKKSLSVSEMAVEASTSPLAGIVIGVIVGVVLLGTGCLYYRDRTEKKKRRRRRRLEKAGIETSDTFRANPNAEVI